MGIIFSSTLNVLFPLQGRSRDVYGLWIYGSQGIFLGVMFHTPELRSTAGGSTQENLSLEAQKALTPASEGLGTQKQWIKP